MSSQKTQTRRSRIEKCLSQTWKMSISKTKTRRSKLGKPKKRRSIMANVYLKKHKERRSIIGQVYVRSRFRQSVFVDMFAHICRTAPVFFVSFGRSAGTSYHAVFHSEIPYGGIRLPQTCMECPPLLTP